MQYILKVKAKKTCKMIHINIKAIELLHSVCLFFIGETIID